MFIPPVWLHFQTAADIIHCLTASSSENAWVAIGNTADTTINETMIPPSPTNKFLFMKLHKIKTNLLTLP